MPYNQIAANGTIVFGANPPTLSAVAIKTRLKPTYEETITFSNGIRVVPSHVLVYWMTVIIKLMYISMHGT